MFRKDSVEAIKWSLFLFGFPPVLIGVPLISTYLLRPYICWNQPISGFLTAVAVVLYGYFFSPNHKQKSAMISFAVGAFLAYQIPEMHWYPECHHLAYTDTHIPLLTTYLAGLAALASVLLHSKSKTNHKPTAQKIS